MYTATAQFGPHPGQAFDHDVDSGREALPQIGVSECANKSTASAASAGNVNFPDRD